ncbi:hypothetical protein [Candidatus Similichlamydia laticola]|nr:hypothetical protein [Candidatus Similichlamydia laticola]
MQIVFDSCALVSVDISCSSLLQWDEVVEQGCQHIVTGSKILWVLHYDCVDFNWFSGRLASSRLALENFLERVLPDFEKQTEGFLLYRGPYKSFKRRVGESMEMLCTLDLILPREMERWIVFEREGESVLEQLEQFATFEAGTIASPIFEGKWSTTAFLRLQRGQIVRVAYPSTVGFCIPASPCKSCLEKIALHLAEEKEEVRLVQEKFLKEQWDLLDKLFLFTDAPHLERILEGFQAAGGVVENRY